MKPESMGKVVNLTALLQTHCWGCIISIINCPAAMNKIIKIKEIKLYPRDAALAASVALMMISSHLIPSVAGQNFTSTS